MDLQNPEKSCECPLGAICERHGRALTAAEHPHCEAILAAKTRVRTRPKPRTRRDFIGPPRPPGMAKPQRQGPPKPCCGGGPSIATKAANATKAAGRVAVAAATGEPVKATPEVIEARRLVCGDCDRNQAGWCGECGCNIAAKTALATEDCPIGRW